MQAQTLFIFFYAQVIHKSIQKTEKLLFVQRDCHLHPSTKKAKHKKCIFVALYFHRKVF